MTLTKRGAALIALASLAAAASLPARADAPSAFLPGVRRHTTLTTTVTDNGDLNPYAIVVAPVSAGRIQQGDVLVDNFNNISNLQGTGGTIVDYNPSTKQTTLIARLPQRLAQCPGGVGLTTAMAMLKSGYIIVGSTPSSDGTTRTRGEGCLLVLDPNAVPAGDVADHVHDLRHAGTLAPLVDDGQIDVQPLGELACPHHAADVGRDDHQVARAVALLDVAGEQGGGEQVVDGDVEEALDLAGMQIHRQHAVRAGLGDQIGDQLGADRRARARFPVLTRIAEIRHDRGDAPRRAPAQRVDHDQQFHEVVVGRVAGALHYEHVLAADVLLDFDEHLHVREPAHQRLAQRQAEHGGHRLGQRPVAVAGNDLHQRGFIGRASWRTGSGTGRVLATGRETVTESRRREQNSQEPPAAGGGLTLPPVLRPSLLAITSWMPPAASSAAAAATSPQ